jgi:AcrR family transcriptional regulator
MSETMAQDEPRDIDEPTTGEGEGALDVREEARRAKRRAVLEAGARMFNRRGYDRAKLDDIAAELSVSKRTLYYYVANKDDILFQCNVLAYEALEPALAIAADRAIPPLDRIRTLLGAYARLLADDFGACLVLTRENLLSPESAEVLRDNRRRLDLTLRGLIEEGLADGSIAACDPRLVAAAMFGAFNWLPHWREPEKSPDYAEIGDAFLDLFLDGLRAKPA